MWIFSKYGFFSVTQHPKRKDNIQIRARKREDLEELKTAAQTLARCVIHETPDADYRFRIIVQRWRWELCAEKLMTDIDYSNFKGKIQQTPKQRDKLPMLHDIWHHCWKYQNDRYRPDPLAGHPDLLANKCVDCGSPMTIVDELLCDECLAEINEGQQQQQPQVPVCEDTGLIQPHCPCPDCLNAQEQQSAET